jgi:Glyoxalase-like domain
MGIHIADGKRATADRDALGRRWASALGWVTVNDDPKEFEIRPAPDQIPGLPLRSRTGAEDNQEPAPSRSPSVAQEPEVARLDDLGATYADVTQGDETWVVLADPEGNEYCVLTPRRRRR